MKKEILIIVFLLFSPVFCLAQDQEPELKASYEKAIILDVQEMTRPMTETELDFSAGGTGFITVQNLKLKILTGKLKGQEKIIENSIGNNPIDLKVNKGDKIIVYLGELGNGEWQIQVQDYYRLPKLIWLVVVFLILLLLIGQKSGLRAIISLLLAGWLIFKVFIPLVLKGVNPIYLVLAISAVITVVTLLIIAGWQRKTLSAILGTVSGLVCAVITAVIFGNLSRLTGLSSEEARMLLGSFSLDFKSVLFSGITIGALGAVMDVAISIASGMAEVKKAKPEISRSKLIGSGIGIGKDIMGTMSSTLIFAYVGASIFVLLLFTEYGESYLKFFNFEFVAEEIIGAISGSIGLILVIPITAVISGYLESKK